MLWVRRADVTTNNARSHFLSSGGRFISRETVETVATVEPIEPRNNQVNTIHANSLCLLYVSNSLQWDVHETPEPKETQEPI